MHPMERLRFLARAGDVPVVPLVREAAAALACFADDPMGLLTACRRLLDRRWDCGPLVWLAARMLTGIDPRGEARRAVAALESDPTVWEMQGAIPSQARVASAALSEEVEDALADRPDLSRIVPVEPPAVVAAADLVVLASDCLGPSGALVDAGAVPIAEVARAFGTPVWLVAGVGRTMPEKMWEPLCARQRSRGAAKRGLAVLEIDRLVTRVATPAGLHSPAEAARQSDCPAVPELFTL